MCEVYGTSEGGSYGTQEVLYRGGLHSPEDLLHPGSWVEVDLCQSGSGYGDLQYVGTGGFTEVLGSCINLKVYHRGPLTGRGPHFPC